MSLWKVWGLVPGTLPRRDLRNLRSLRRSKGRRGRGAGGGGPPKGRKPSKASKVRTKASKPPSKPSKASKPSRARTKGPSKPSKPPSLKPTFSPNERRKATRERFWGLKTKKKRQEENETKQTPFTKSQRSLQTKKGESHTRTLLGVKSEEKEIRRK